jgi:catechol 2,3-dioxygenase-like lactoylglutathione lyase family enzyme
MRPHISINVSNVSKSAEFYEKVFGVKPQKKTTDYAKFDLQKPALNFSMQFGSELSKVNHFGIEVDSADMVKMWEELFVARGVLTKPEENTKCCFALQDKVWVQDPDGNTWEVFYVHKQLTTESKPSACSPVTAVFGKKCC